MTLGWLRCWLMVLVSFSRTHVLPVVVADASATPRNFFPDEQAELVAGVKDEAVLLVVSEANEVRALLNLFCSHTIQKSLCDWLLNTKGCFEVI